MRPTDLFGAEEPGSELSSSRSSEKNEERGSDRSDPNVPSQPQTASRKKEASRGGPRSPARRGWGGITRPDARWSLRAAPGVRWDAQSVRRAARAAWYSLQVAGSRSWAAPD